MEMIVVFLEDKHVMVIVDKIKKPLLFLFYSFSVALILRFSAFSYEGINKYNCFIGLVIVVIGSYWVQKENNFSLSIFDKLIYISMPILFFERSWFDEDIIYNFTNPYIVGVGIIILNFSFLKDLKKYKNSLFFFTFIFLYSFLYFENWQYYRFGDWRDKSVLLSLDKPNDTIKVDLKLTDYNFINTKLDTIKISKIKPYTFIITWDEYCAICKPAFKGLIPILEKYENVEKYYIYNFKKYNSKSYIDSYNKQNILHNKNVIADYNYFFTQRIGVFANPTILILNNRTNKIIYLAVGYSDYNKKILTQTLNKLK